MLGGPVSVSAPSVGKISPEGMHEAPNPPGGKSREAINPPDHRRISRRWLQAPITAGGTRGYQQESGQPLRGPGIYTEVTGFPAASPILGAAACRPPAQINPPTSCVRSPRARVLNDPLDLDNATHSARIHVRPGRPVRQKAAYSRSALIQR